MEAERYVCRGGVWSATAIAAEIVQEGRCARATSAARAVATAIVEAERYVCREVVWSVSAIRTAIAVTD